MVVIIIMVPMQADKFHSPNTFAFLSIKLDSEFGYNGPAVLDTAKSLKVPIKTSVTAIRAEGSVRGKIICLIIENILAPKFRAASTTSFRIDSMAELMINIWNGTFFHTCIIRTPIHIYHFLKKRFFNNSQKYQ